MTEETPSLLPTLQRLVALFRSAMTELGKAPDETELERLGVLIHASMSGRGRSYHTVEHVFQVTGQVDAIGTLAMLFHDTVYCEVDGGLPQGLEVHLGDALRVDRSRVELNPFDPGEDVLRGLVAHLFGFTPGQPVTPQSGLNELASALLAVRALRPHLTTRELAEVVACIEATIPFRPPHAEEALAARLTAADLAHGLGLGAEGVEAAVRRAVRVANDDVGNFAFEDGAAFLSHTWEILPENNPTLRMPAYTIGEYRVAIGKMAGFLGSLAPERVFRAFRGAPAADALELLRARARANLARGTRYLRQKLLSARLLQALANATGGDAPISLFMGDLPGMGDSLRLQDLLPPPPDRVAEDVCSDVVRLLVEGRKKESGFDLRNSPLAAYLYLRLGGAESDRMLALGDDALLDGLPEHIVGEVATACARMAPTRAAMLTQLAARDARAAARLA